MNKTPLPFLGIGLLALATCISPPVTAASDAIRDDDISGTASAVRNHAFAPSLNLQPDRVLRSPRNTGLELRVEVLRKNGQVLPIEGLAFYAGELELRTDQAGTLRLDSCAPRSQYRWTAELRDSHFQVGDGDTNYQLSTSVDCGVQVVLQFQEDSDGGQPLGIWRIAQLGKRKLAEAIGLNFWNRPVGFIWPADGDYYSFGQVHITRGEQWDVVGHEMGHAIYDLGRIGGSQGGMHKIDECYNPTLALSEGWASYFSAWLSLDPQDPDAKFEYLVPRRAPIRIEHVPADVCRGPTNEWRVSAFLWDFVDLNSDGEEASESFRKLWNALQGSRAPGAASASALLEKAGVAREWVNLLWELNFQTPRSSQP